MTEIRGLIIDKKPEAAAQLNQALLPEIMLSEFALRPNLHKGLQSLSQSEYDVCFISEAFPSEDLSAFFSDIKALSKNSEVLFVQVKEKLEEGFNRQNVEAQGFSTVVTRELSEGDKAALASALTEFLHAREIGRKKLDVDSAVKLIFLEIERVYRNRKRGLNSTFNRGIVSDFIAEHLTFHSDVLGGYIEALERHTKDSPPVKAIRVEIPESAKHMPGMSEGNYVGVSLRVWDKLQEKFGVDDAEGESRQKPRESDLTPEELERRAEERIKNRLKEMGVESDD